MDVSVVDAAGRFAGQTGGVLGISTSWLFAREPYLMERYACGHQGPSAQQRSGQTEQMDRPGRTVPDEPWDAKLQRHGGEQCGDDEPLAPVRYGAEGEGQAEDERQQRHREHMGVRDLHHLIEAFGILQGRFVASIVPERTVSRESGSHVDLKRRDAETDDRQDEKPCDGKFHAWRGASISEGRHVSATGESSDRPGQRW